MEYVGLYIKNGQVITDTHGFMAEKTVKATDLARKTYPEAKEFNGSLFVNLKENVESARYVFNIPETGIYEITLDRETVRVILEKDRKIDYWLRRYTDFNLTRVG